ncbi:MAG: cyclase family protein [Deltaproteobacteria bacterium]|jgi:arylformamidase|nr:cyclase family protein [Deltaproteobacteria bacterium]
MKKFYDVTLPIENGMKVYPGDMNVSIDRIAKIEDDGCDVRELHFSSHVGTHIDAPCHFIEGAKTLDDMSFDLMVGEVQVVETDADVIDRKVLKNLKIDYWKVIFFKTKNGALWSLDKFSENFVSLTKDAAEFLVEKGTKLVGIDYFSIETFHTHEYPVHKKLLGNDIFIVESLYLNDVPAGRYNLHCLPIRLSRADGASARIILQPT